jgi:Arc/MetJ-type ribon-helix-helix transcriptional regulator
MSKMITVRMPEEGVARIDALVEGGAYPTRASFVVEAINRLVAEIEEREIDRRIVEGYTRIPQTEEDRRWAEASARRSIDEEPW